MPVQPTVKFYDLTAVTTNSYNMGTGSWVGLINRLNQTSGGNAGPQTSIEVGPTAQVFNFNSTQAGTWCIPQPLVIEFTDDSTDATPAAQQLRFKVYDTDDGQAANPTSDQNEAFFSVTPAWQFRFALSNRFINPATINLANIELGDAGVALGTAAGESIIAPSMSLSSTKWIDLQYGADPGNHLDQLVTDLSLTGNDGQPKILTQRPSSVLWYLNFFLYIAIKPRVDAPAGVHQSWGYRLNYVYPGT